MVHSRVQVFKYALFPTKMCSQSDLLLKTVVLYEIFRNNFKLLSRGKWHRVKMPNLISEEGISQG